MFSAKAYRRSGKWYFHAENKTTDGVWIASPPFLHSDGDSFHLGSCAKCALAHSAEGVVHPTEWKHIFTPMLDLAGVKSWNIFARGAELVGIEMEGHTIKLTPHRNLGPKEGFDPVADLAIRLRTDASHEDLGNAVLALVTP